LAPSGGRLYEPWRPFPTRPTVTRSPRTADAVRPYLREETKSVASRVVVATGTHATESVLAIDAGDLDGFLESVLEPVSLPTLDVPLVPILHPSSQDVWLRRLGYDPAGYTQAVAKTLAHVGEAADPADEGRGKPS